MENATQLPVIDFKNICTLISDQRKCINHLLFVDGMITDLIDFINNQIETFRICHVPSNNTLILKIKKSSIKGRISFVHNTQCYYMIMNNILLEFLTLHIDRLTEIGSQLGINYIPVDMNTIGMVYMIQVLMDNTVSFTF